MKKRLLTSAFACIMLAVGLVTAVSAGDMSAKEATTVNVSISGITPNLQPPAMLIGSTTYVPLRDFCTAMGAQRVVWDGEMATVSAPGLTIEARAAGSYIIANGRYLLADCRVTGDELIVPVRVLAEAFDATIGWNGTTRTVFVTKGSGAIISGDNFYDETDLLWMSRIINAEARGEILKGKIAVGNVVMNRVASPSFPDTVYGVIFDKRSGIQFTPAYSGAIYNTPSEECVIAAKIALDGGNVAGDSLYFSSKWQSCWAARNRPFTMTIGNHSFYA